MDSPSPQVRDLAKRLLAASVATREASHPRIHEAVLVSEKLRVPVTKFAGAEGFASLQRRALALASANVPSLRGVKIGKDGRLEGFDLASGDVGVAGVAGGAGGGGHSAAVDAGAAEREEAAMAITNSLLGLLVTFIGEPFTLRLVREA